jgi:nucleotide-binding universal stress UspA family protein
MRRVIVALDGSRQAEQIIPDACRLAGDDGVLVLVHDASLSAVDTLSNRTVAQRHAISDSAAYLRKLAQRLQDLGINTETHTTTRGSAQHALDAAPFDFHGDVIALATHGRSVGSRLVHGGVTWNVFVHSPVPVLIRHVVADEFRDVVSEPPVMGPRHILVPLDGSELAEEAVPLAAELARAWNADLELVRVVPDATMILEGTAWGPMAPAAYDVSSSAESRRSEAVTYLTNIATRLAPLRVKQRVLEGHTLDALCTAVHDHGITDVVMASHGHAGLARVLIGSVADGMIHRLHVPILVIPSLAQRKKSAVELLVGHQSS